jgi:hypothetical protein
VVWKKATLFGAIPLFFFFRESQYFCRSSKARGVHPSIPSITPTDEPSARRFVHNHNTFASRVYQSMTEEEELEISKVGATFQDKVEPTTQWCYSLPNDAKWTEERFSEPHSFPVAKYVFSTHCNCTYVSSRRVPLAPGGSWLDLWKAIDKMRTAPGVYCDHRFIELLRLQSDGGLDVVFGS